MEKYVIKGGNPLVGEVEYLLGLKINYLSMGFIVGTPYTFWNRSLLIPYKSLLIRSC